MNALCVIAVVLLFRLPHGDYVTLLPKSVTGAVGMPLSAELGGAGEITMAAISVTGLFGNILGTQILQLFRVNDRVAKGIALGCGSHAFGTVRALEYRKIGALSSCYSRHIDQKLTKFLRFSLKRNGISHKAKCR